MQEEIKILLKELSKEDCINILEDYLKGYSGDIGTRAFNEAIENVLIENQKLKKENILLKEHVHLKKCNNCGKEFKSKRSDAMYCKNCNKEKQKIWYYSRTEEQKEKRKIYMRNKMRELRAKKKIEEQKQQCQKMKK